MKRQHRHERILELLQTAELDIERLASTLNVSVATVRRDLGQLAEEGKITRTYGGAVLPPTRLERSLQERAMIAKREKEAIGQAAASHVVEGDTLVLDAGTTTGALARHLRHFEHLKVITNGFSVMLALAEELSRWNDHRRVHLYFGVRRIDDLYGLERLSMLAHRDPCLRVVPCISEDRRFRGERGVLADVLHRHALEHDSWTRHDIYVAGSGPMVAGTVGQLLDLGVDERRMRFDSFDRMAGVMLDVRRLALAKSI